MNRGRETAKDVSRQRCVHSSQEEPSMCYSAECWALYDGYVKEFGADIDIKALTRASLDG